MAIYALIAALSLMSREENCSAATLKTVYAFCSQENCVDGEIPNDLMFDAARNTIYGTTQYGGASGQGTVFSLTRNKNGKWKHTLLHEFSCDIVCPGGWLPSGPLIQDTAGNLYGTTRGGGANGSGGSVFEMVRHGKSWTFQSLHDFCQQQQCMDGAAPAGLTYAGASGGAPYDGTSTLYGLNSYAGTHVAGTAFSLTPGGGGGWTYTNIYTFDGLSPTGVPTLDANGNLYGRFSYDPNPRGAIFKLAYGGGQWDIAYYYEFTGGKDGSQPNGDLYVDASGNVFGVTLYGGNSLTYPSGTIFEVTGSTFQTIASFCLLKNCKDGSLPTGGLKPDASGDLVAVVEQGGKYGHGAVYKWTGAATELLYSFCRKDGCPDGDQPFGNVLFDLSGHMFGLTNNKAGGGSEGTVFELTP